MVVRLMCVFALLALSCAGSPRTVRTHEVGPGSIDFVVTDERLAEAMEQHEKMVGEAIEQLRLLYEKGCKEGDLPSCTGLGMILYVDEEIPDHMARAGELFEKACTGGDGMGCFMLGFMLLEGAQADEARARELFEKACGLNLLEGCYSLGLLLIEGVGGEADVERGIALLEEGCATGSGKACSSLGELYWKGMHVHADHELALGYFERACQVRDEEGCFLEGTLLLELLEDKTIEFSVEAVKESFDAFDEACKLGLAGACNLVGELFVSGEIDIWPYRPKKARKYFIRACKLGCPAGCAALGRWYLVHGKDSDASKAVYPLGKACEAQDPLACLWLGQMYQKGRGVEADADKAGELLEKSCDLGEELACTALVDDK